MYGIIIQAALGFNPPWPIFFISRYPEDNYEDHLGNHLARNGRVRTKQFHYRFRSRPAFLSFSPQKI